MPILPTLAFVTIVITGMVILIFRDWRFNAFALGFQYLAAFLLVDLSWPIEMALIKLIVGWMATVSIGLTCLRQLKIKDRAESSSSLLFRGISGLVVIVVVFIITPTVQINIFPNVDLLILQGGLMLFGLTLMQLGMSAEPYLIIMSLLGMMTGFEIIHAALELSMLLSGLLVIVNLGLALLGVYFVTKSGEKKTNYEEEPNQ
jgi:hypothetical protein